MARADKALLGGAGLVATGLVGVIGFSIKEVIKQTSMTRAQNLAYRAFNLTEEEVSAEWTIQKVCAYKFIGSLDFVFGKNITENQLVAFNNVMQRSPADVNDDKFEESEAGQVFSYDWSIGQALAASELSVEDALSQNFTNAELVAVNFGASIEDIRDNTWNDATTFLFKKYFTTEQIIGLGKEGVEDLYNCALTTMYSGSFDARALKSNCEFEVTPEYSPNMGSVFFSTEDVLMDMSCGRDAIFPPSRCDHLAGAITSIFFGC